MSRRREIYLLVVLLAIAAGLFLRGRVGRVGNSSAPGAVTADGKFVPLDVHEPNLRLDLLEKIHNTKYTGLQRDIFSGQPLPPPRSKLLAAADKNPGVAVPSGPPPVQVPAQFFGYADESGSTNRLAFFLSGDDVLIVAVGDTFLGNFRLLQIGNASAEVQQLSDGRTTAVPLEQPPDQAMVP